MAFLLILGLVAVSVVVSVVNGFVLSYLWQWFVTPLGIPAIGLAHAIGLGMIIRYLTKSESNSENTIGSAIVDAFLGPFVMLGLGAIVKAFM